MNSGLKALPEQLHQRTSCYLFVVIELGTCVPKFLTTTHRPQQKDIFLILTTYQITRFCPLSKWHHQIQWKTQTKWHHWINQLTSLLIRGGLVPRPDVYSETEPTSSLFPVSGNGAAFIPEERKAGGVRRNVMCQSSSPGRRMVV